MEDYKKAKDNTMFLLNDIEAIHSETSNSQTL